MESKTKFKKTNNPSKIKRSRRAGSASAAADEAAAAAPAPGADAAAAAEGRDVAPADPAPRRSFWKSLSGVFRSRSSRHNSSSSRVEELSAAPVVANLINVPMQVTPVLVQQQEAVAKEQQQQDEEAPPPLVDLRPEVTVVVGTAAPTREQINNYVTEMNELNDAVSGHATQTERMRTPERTVFILQDNTTPSLLEVLEDDNVTITSANTTGVTTKVTLEKKRSVPGGGGGGGGGGGFVSFKSDEELATNVAESVDECSFVYSEEEASMEDEGGVVPTAEAYVDPAEEERRRKVAAAAAMVGALPPPTMPINKSRSSIGRAVAPVLPPLLPPPDAGMTVAPETTPEDATDALDVDLRRRATVPDDRKLDVVVEDMSHCFLLLLDKEANEYTVLYQDNENMHQHHQQQHHANIQDLDVQLDEGTVQDDDDDEEEEDEVVVPIGRDLSFMHHNDDEEDARSMGESSTCTWSSALTAQSDSELQTLQLLSGATTRLRRLNHRHHHHHHPQQQPQDATKPTVDDASSDSSSDLDLPQPSADNVVTEGTLQYLALQREVNETIKELIEATQTIQQDCCVALDRLASSDTEAPPPAPPPPPPPLKEHVECVAPNNNVVVNMNGILATVLVTATSSTPSSSSANRLPAAPKQPTLTIHRTHHAIGGRPEIPLSVRRTMSGTLRLLQGVYSQVCREHQVQQNQYYHRCSRQQQLQRYHMQEDIRAQLAHPGDVPDGGVALMALQREHEEDDGCKTDDEHSSDDDDDTHRCCARLSQTYQHEEAPEEAVDEDSQQSMVTGGSTPPKPCAEAPIVPEESADAEVREPQVTSGHSSTASLHCYSSTVSLRRCSSTGTFHSCTSATGTAIHDEPPPLPLDSQNFCFGRRASRIWSDKFDATCKISFGMTQNAPRAD